jgi:hypothetical protein
MANRLPGWEEAAQRVEEGMTRIAETDQRRKAMLARTKVDFSLLNDIGDAGGNE